MANTLEGWISYIDGLFGNSLTLERAQVQELILEAVDEYSRDCPLEMVSDIAGDGDYDYTLPSDFDEDYSFLLKVEYPAGEQDPVIIDPRKYTVYRSDTGYSLRFFETEPSASYDIRATYYIPHTLSTTSTIPNTEWRLVCKLAASKVAFAEAIRRAGTKSTSLPGDTLNFRSLSDQWRSIAKELRKDYEDGIARMPAFIQFSIEQQPTWEESWLSHPNHN